MVCEKCRKEKETLNVCNDADLCDDCVEKIRKYYPQIEAELGIQKLCTTDPRDLSWL